VVGASLGGWWGTLLAAVHPDRFDGACCVSGERAREPVPERLETVFDEEVETEEAGADALNPHYMLRNFPGFAAFFAARWSASRIRPSKSRT